MAETEGQPLRPRFKIQKRKIGGETTSEEIEFSPEKVIYVELDDEITTLFDRIKHTRPKRIAMVVPKRASLLQSIVNLKILKKKVEELGKEMLIVTSDTAGLALAEKAGIPAVPRLWEKTDMESLSASPAQLPHGQKPIRLKGEKISISEVIHSNRSDFFASLLKKLRERFRKKKEGRNATRLVFVAPNKQALFTLILVSVLLLLAIAYIALPGATITITPRSTILDPSFNVTFADYGKNRELIERTGKDSIIIPSFPVNPPVLTKKLSRPATGKIFKGKNAKGIVTIINTSGNPWELAGRTRFQTEDGLVFRIGQPVRVPAAKGSVPGTLDAPVTADEFDTFGQIIGARGNIPPSKFVLPGLKNPENRKKLYGESRMPMSGGTTETVAIVTQTDVEATKEIAKREIAAAATTDLKNYLEQQNLSKKTNLSLLEDRHAIVTGEPVISADDNLIGTTREMFEIQVKYTLRGIAFDRQELIATLKERLMNRVDPDKKLLKTNEDDVSYKFLDQEESRGRIRLTATLRAIQMYDLDPEKENGSRFLKKITDHILGMRVKDAETYLKQQTGEITNVEITTWPIWAPTIPTIGDNIKFVIKDDLQE